jgi:hypothetical protein
MQLLEGGEGSSTALAAAEMPAPGAFGLSGVGGVGASASPLLPPSVGPAEVASAAGWYSPRDAAVAAAAAAFGGGGAASADSYEAAAAAAAAAAADGTGDGDDGDDGDGAALGSEDLPPALPPLTPAERVAFGYKLLLYLKYCFTGRAFPRGEPAPGHALLGRAHLCAYPFGPEPNP